MHVGVGDIAAAVDLRYVSLYVQDVHTLLALQHDGGYRQLRVEDEVVGAFFCNQIQFEAYFEARDVNCATCSFDGCS